MAEETEQAESDPLEVEKNRAQQQLTYLFGKDIVDQAELIDIADLNISDKITQCISDGVIQLKKLKGKKDSQRTLVKKMSSGEKLVLCLWIMDMGLLDKLQV
jgi:hypothetical protein